MVISFNAEAVGRGSHAGTINNVVCGHLLIVSKVPCKIVSKARTITGRVARRNLVSHLGRLGRGVSGQRYRKVFQGPHFVQELLVQTSPGN
jgi:hypothetical protein